MLHTVALPDGSVLVCLSVLRCLVVVASLRIESDAMIFSEQEAGGILVPAEAISEGSSISTGNEYLGTESARESVSEW